MKPQVPIGVALPTIPPRAYGSPPVDPPAGFPAGMPRASMLDQAVWSVQQQTVAPAGMWVALDVDREGAAATRQRALDMVDAEYVAFLDDDDLWYPHHLEVHWNLLREHDADVAYSWFDGNEPFPEHRGRRWDPDQPHHITMAITVRTELAKAVGFSTPNPRATATCAGEDWMFILGLNDSGAKFVGTGEVTWHYRVHGANTSGLATRW